MVRIYTKRGDDGTTGLLYGGRVSKDDAVMHLNGTVDEAQAVIGVARAEAEAGSELDSILTGLERDLYVLMAEVATAPENRSKLVPGSTQVTDDMISSVEERIDSLIERIDMPAEFVIPGANKVSASLDLARTVVRRAERLWVTVPVEGSLVGRYLNRLSDVLWALGRWTEGDQHLLAKSRSRRPSERSEGPARPDQGGDGGDGGGEPS